MTTTLPEADDYYVLTLDAVRRAITTLKPLSIHESFPAYLHLRHRAKQLGRFTDLQPDWNGEVNDWLAVPGGPPNKPYFRPFTSRGSKADSFWLNHNLAGSYAPSSLRNIRALYLDADDKFLLPTKPDGLPDVKPVRQRLLDDKEIPAWAIAAFLFRNHRFVAPKGSELPTWRDLLQFFQGYFDWTADETSGLFTWLQPEIPAFETEVEDHG